MSRKIKHAILRALSQCVDVPMPEGALIAAVELQLRHHSPTRADIQLAVSALESDQLIQGLTDLLGERTWSLTEKGRHAVANLRLAA